MFTAPGMRNAIFQCGPLFLWVDDFLAVGGVRVQVGQDMGDQGMEGRLWVRRMERILGFLEMGRGEVPGGGSILGHRVRRGYGSRSV